MVGERHRTRTATHLATATKRRGPQAWSRALIEVAACTRRVRTTACNLGARRLRTPAQSRSLQARPLSVPRKQCGDHSFEQLSCERPLATRLKHATAHLSKTALHLPDCPRCHYGADQQRNNTPQTNRSRRFLFNCLTLAKYFRLLEGGGTSISPRVLRPQCETSKNPRMNSCAIVSNLNVRPQIIPKSMPCGVVRKWWLFKLAQQLINFLAGQAQAKVEWGFQLATSIRLLPGTRFVVQFCHDRDGTSEANPVLRHIGSPGRARES